VPVIAKARKMTTGTGTWSKIFPWPIQTKLGSNPLIGPPAANSNAAPRNADMPPSVTTNGGTFSLVIARPCSSPPATPTPIAARAARYHGLLAANSAVPTVNRLESPPLDTAAAARPAKATSEPIERSIPAVKMTKVIPTASRP
jgi:hypothetical protein